MSSAAMALASHGTQQDPGTLNAWLGANGGYADRDLIVWGSIGHFGSLMLYGDYRGAGSLAPADFQSALAKDWPVIVNVRHGGHWVFVTGWAGNTTYNVNDAGFDVNTYDYADMSNFVVYQVQ